MIFMRSRSAKLWVWPVSRLSRKSWYSSMDSQKASTRARLMLLNTCKGVACAILFSTKTSVLSQSSKTGFGDSLCCAKKVSRSQLISQRQRQLGASTLEIKCVFLSFCSLNFQPFAHSGLATYFFLSLRCFSSGARKPLTSML